MRLVKRVITAEDHLGIETGPLDQEQISISGVHKDVADGSFRQTLGSGNPIWGDEIQFQFRQISFKNYSGW